MKETQILKIKTVKKVSYAEACKQQKLYTTGGQMPRSAPTRVNNKSEFPPLPISRYAGISSIASVRSHSEMETTDNVSEKIDDKRSKPDVESAKSVYD